MMLFRFLPTVFFLAAVLPCAAQSKLPTKPLKPVPQIKMPSHGQISACVLKLPDGMQLKGLSLKPCSEAQKDIAHAKNFYVLDKNSQCYAIRDYRFESSKGAGFPKLKSYSTCVSAARFEARNVTAPVTVQAANPTR